MSRSRNNQHSKNYDFWSRRPMRYAPSCKWEKQKCHRIERLQAQQEIVKEIDSL